MEAYSRIELSALDNFDVAIVRVDADGVITYLNGAARNLLGCPPGLRVDLRMLFPDPEEFQHAVANLQYRLQGNSSTYRTRFWRPCDPTPPPPVPVRVHAFPNSDPDGRPVGAIALVDDMREPEARMAINSALATSVGTRQLLDSVVEEVGKIVPYDEIHVTIISQSRRRMRELYEKNASRAFRDLVRWWTMPDFIREGLPGRLPELCHVDAMRADPRYRALAQTDADTAAFFKLNVREFLSIPVRQDNQVVAFLALYSYRDGRYCEDNLEQLLRLPLAEAVMAALHRDRDRRQQLILRLLQRMGELAVDPRKVADEMVNDLLRHFQLEGWEHVSVFEHDRQAGLVRLLCQDSHDGRILPDRFAMPCTTGAGGDGQAPFSGPVAEAAVTGLPVCRTADRLGSPRAGLPGFVASGSHLALPILGDSTRWVLYIESHVMNAFAEEETGLLELLTARAGAILAHSTLFAVQTAVLQSIGDAVIEATPDGLIRWCNDAAQSLFGIDAAVPAGVRLSQLAADDDAARALADTGNFYHREVNLRSVAGEAFPVLLSASTPEHLNGRVYVASDFRYQKEVQRLDELKEVSRQAALEGRVPLALAGAWLAQRGDQDPAWRDDIEKILQQLKRADLPLERLLRLSSPPMMSLIPAASDLGQALGATLADLPASLRRDIEVEQAAGPLGVNGDFDDIQFCVESMIAFGMRSRPESKKLHVSTHLVPPWAALRVEGDWVPQVRAGVPLDRVERARRKTLYDLMLGESVLQDIARRAGGSFTPRLETGLFLELALPVRGNAGATP